MNNTSCSQCPMCQRSLSISDYPFVNVLSVVVNDKPEYLPDLLSDRNFYFIEDVSKDIITQIPDTYNSVLVGDKVYTRTSSQCVIVGDNEIKKLTPLVQEVQEDLQKWKTLQGKTVSRDSLPVSYSYEYENKLHLFKIDSKCDTYALAIMRKTGHIGLDVTYGVLCTFGYVELQGCFTAK